MNLLSIEGLSKQMGERLLFDHASLAVNEGDRIGLIGVNGSGKSTLLRIVAGLEGPDAGAVNMWGGLRVEFLPQEPPLEESWSVLQSVFASESPQMQLLRRYEEVSEALQAIPDDAGLHGQLTALAAELDRTGGWGAEANAKAILTKLGVTDFSARVGTLSGGQRKRVALARALIDRADLLILDEPTNHIDADSVAWLEEYLATSPGALLMVTHDRYFLDRVVNRIIELDRRQLVSYPGNYARYLELSAERSLNLAEAEDKRRNLLRRELEWLRRGAMARGTKQKARKQRVEELMQIRYDRGDDVVAIMLAGRRLGNKVLHSRNLTVAYDGRRVVDGVSLELEQGGRIGIVGPNGAGKSTLLDLLAGKVAGDEGVIDWGDTVQIGYYDQRSEALDDQVRLLDFIEKEAPLMLTKDGERVEAAKMLEWFLFPRAMHRAKIGSLSGGERRRLYLLRTLVHRPNVLFLDEPTNDLDVQTLTVLEEYLDHFAGSVIVVSHDRYFLDRTVDYLMEMDNGKLGPRYPAPYATFARLRQEARDSVAVEQVGPRRVEASAVTGDSVRKLSWKETRELEKLEAQVGELETRKQELELALAASGQDYQAVQRAAAELEATDAELNRALARWLELSTIGEAAQTQRQR